MKLRFIHIALSFLLIVSGALVSMAQPEKFYSTFKLMELKEWDKAKVDAEALCNHPKTSSDPKSWYYKGFIYKEIYKLREQTNAQAPSRKLALEAFAKCVALDTKHEYIVDCKAGIKFLITPLKNEGAISLNKEDFTAAYQFYTLYLDNYKYLEPNAVDQTAIFYRGYAAIMTSQWAKAHKDMSYLYKAKSSQVLVSMYLAQSLWNLNQKDSALVIIEESYKTNPDNFKIENAYLDYYMLTNKLDELEGKQKKIIKAEPSNVNAKLLLGSIYDKKAEKDHDNRKKYSDEAKEVYKSILDKDINNFKANYKMGHKLYVDAVLKVSELDLTTDIFALEQVQNECSEMYKDALKYMTKAYELEQKNTAVLSSLSSIYVALNDPDKSNQVKQELHKIETGQ